ncbi:MAG: Holliday junction resolvase RuvX [Gemmataceae bacterium]
MSTRVLAIDFGRKRLGLAISDPERKIASPLANYTRTSRGADLAYLKKVIAAEEPGTLLIGLALHNSGAESELSKAARAFGKWLGEETELPVCFWDERYSSVMAEKELWQAGLTHRRRKERRDMVAAQMVLEAWLEAGCPAGREE